MRVSRMQKTSRRHIHTCEHRCASHDGFDRDESLPSWPVPSPIPPDADHHGTEPAHLPLLWLAAWPQQADSRRFRLSCCWAYAQPTSHARHTPVVARFKRFRKNKHPRAHAQRTVSIQPIALRLSHGPQQGESIPPMPAVAVPPRSCRPMRRHQSRTTRAKCPRSPHARSRRASIPVRTNIPRQYGLIVDKTAPRAHPIMDSSANRSVTHSRFSAGKATGTHR